MPTTITSSQNVKTMKIQSCRASRHDQQGSPAERSPGNLKGVWEVDQDGAGRRIPWC